MNRWKIREYSAADIPQLARLWHDSFGDTEGFTEKFFSALPQIGSGLAAELDGRIVGAAYTLDGQSLVTAEGQKQPVGYIYGVSVDKAYQGLGIGAELTRQVYALSKSRVAEIVCTLPAEDSLYGWYEKLIGVKPCLCREVRTVRAEKLLPCSMLSATEYGKARKKLLSGKNRLELSEAAMGFQGKLLEEYGGGFFAVGGGICGAYTYDGKAFVKELITAQPEESEKMAAAVADFLGVTAALLYLPSQRGEKYIASDTPIPADCVWNLSFD